MTLRTSNGYPFTILEALPTIRTGIRIEVYDRDDPDTLIDVLPDTRNRSWVDPLNDVGAGEFEIHEDDPKLAANPNILRGGNIVRCYLDNIARFSFPIESRDRAPISDAEDAGRWIKVSGRGSLAILEDGAVYPAGSVAGEADRDTTGMTPGEAFIQFKDEADARGAIVEVMSVGFTDALDTANQPYNFTLPEAARAGRDDLLKLITRYAELGVDIDITPDLEIRMYTNGLGVDRSIQTEFIAPVILRPAHNLKELDIHEDLIIKNTLLIETAIGFFERAHATSATEHGRREGFLSLGNTTDGDYIDRATDAAFLKLADIRTAITAEVLDVDGHRPYVDYNKGDWVLAPNADGVLTRWRVRGLTVTEDDSGNPIFVPTLNDHDAEIEDRLQRWLRTMSPGTLGGTATEVATPNTSTTAESVATADAAVDAHEGAVLHPDELSDLLDVDLDGIENLDLLQIVDGEWVPLPLKIDLSTPPTDDQVLKFDDFSGLWKPAAESGGGGAAGMTKLAEIDVTTAGAVLIDPIPGGHRDLLITGLIQGSPSLRFGTGGVIDTGNNYEYIGHQHRTGGEFDEAAQAQSSLKFGRNIPSGSDERANYATPIHILIPGYTATTFYRTVWAQSTNMSFSATNNMRLNVEAATWRNNSDPIDCIEFTSLNIGSRLTVYGLG